MSSPHVQIWRPLFYAEIADETIVPTEGSRKLGYRCGFAVSSGMPDHFAVFSVLH